MGWPHRYQSHVGRVSVTAAAMMATSMDGAKCIQTDELEYNHNWKRGTNVLSSYIGKNGALAQGSFIQKMVEIRNKKLDAAMDEQAIQGINNEASIDVPSVQQWLLKQKLI